MTTPQKIDVALGARSYPILIGDGVARNAAHWAEWAGTRKLAIVTNTVVAPLYADALEQTFGDRQVLRIVPPTAGTTVASAPVVVPVPATSPATASAQAPAAASTGVTTSSVSGSSVTAQPLPTPATPAATPAPAPASKPSPAPQPARGGDDAVNVIWPASGSVVASFDEQKNKGVGIAGKAGDPVLAAAEGRVVYAGSGLRGYGNLIILKHNNTFLTAYAHNQALLVKEDQDVKQGQKIAEMGSSDADRVKLHFEVRRNGKPVDPAKFLPSR